MTAYVEKMEKTWSMLISCVHMGGLAIPPVRITDKWVSHDVGKVDMGDDLQPGPAASLDWLQPESTIIPASDGAKTEPGADSLRDNPAIMGPKLPEVVFMATLDPPLHVPLFVWQQIRQLGGDLTQPDMAYTTLDSLMFPIPPGSHNDPTELRTITRTKPVEVKSSPAVDLSTRTYRSTLYIYKPVYGQTLREIPFSHPQQLITMLPFLRQYAFLSTLLHNSFGETEDDGADAAKLRSDDQTIQRDASATRATVSTTKEDDFAAFMAGTSKKAIKNKKHNAQAAVAVDLTLNLHPIPRLQIVFPFRSTTANVVLEIRLNGEVHVDSQNVLDEKNSTAPNGRQRRPEDLGKLLESVEDVCKWCEFIRTRWA